MSEAPALELTRALIRRQSITPEDAGCQDFIADRLVRAGFTIERLRFGSVDNLWAVAGSGGPLLCLAGHTDVVPAGPAERWSHAPFTAEIADGLLYGRGAADMKSGVAALVCAAERFQTRRPGHSGRLALLLTSDEEGQAQQGTRAVIDHLSQQGKQIDYCLLGEPSSNMELADTIKNGRRGSLNAVIKVNGKQGHVAYPHKADNALHRLLGLLHDLEQHHWDAGDESFPPTSFQISRCLAGTHAENVIPGEAEAACNWRYCPLQTPESIRSATRHYCQQHRIDPEAIQWRESGRPFITASGALLDSAQAAIARHCGQKAETSTGGGTSDGRYIAPSGAEVVELGPVNASIHQVDEHVRVADIERLTAIYADIIATLLA
jgi:succinyl-diaminopimelate desuccinylase